MKKAKTIMKFFREPVFGIGFDLYVGVPFEKMKEKYYKSRFILNLNESPTDNGRSINDEKHNYHIIWIRDNKQGLPIFVHEVIHQLHLQIRQRNIGFGNSFEILAYMTEYFVRELNLYLDKRKKC